MIIYVENKTHDFFNLLTDFIPEIMIKYGDVLLENN